jgi:hypothetical protein
MALERPVALRERGLRADVGGVPALQERRADPRQLVLGNVRHGALVQHVAPRQIGPATPAPRRPGTVASPLVTFNITR